MRIEPSSIRWARAATLAAVLASVPAGALATEAAAKSSVYLATITDTECGPSHARMLATGTMGSTDEECTRACIRKGATYGAVVSVGKKKRFYQLDDQEKPAAFAGRKVRITGRIEGDTLFVDRIEPRR